MLSDALVRVENRPGDAGRTHKQGYMMLLEVGDDVAREVCLPAAMRILDGKAPYPVIVANARDLAKFEAAMDAYRVRTTEQLGEESVPHRRKQYEALLEATHRVTVIDESEADVIGTLGERDKLYLPAHGVGLHGIAFRLGDAWVPMPLPEVARALADAELDPRFRDIRLSSCKGALPAVDGGPPVAQRLADEFGKLGFENIEVSAYRGNLYASLIPFGDGKHHKAVRAGPGHERMRASTVRQTFRYVPDADHLSPR